MTKPVCVVTGVGPATGSALVRRFASGGYRVAMLARNAGRLDALEKELPDVHAFPCDVTDRAQVDATLAAVETKLGAVDVLVHAFQEVLSPLDSTKRHSRQRRKS